jgi:hypothetical protein
MKTRRGVGVTAGERKPSSPQNAGCLPFKANAPYPTIGTRSPSGIARGGCRGFDSL